MKHRLIHLKIFKLKLQFLKKQKKKKKHSSLTPPRTRRGTARGTLTRFNLNLCGTIDPPREHPQEANRAYLLRP